MIMKHLKSEACCVIIAIQQLDSLRKTHKQWKMQSAICPRLEWKNANNSMKSKTNGCGHNGNGNGKKKGKGGYVEIEIKMERMPKKKAKKK